MQHTHFSRQTRYYSFNCSQYSAILHYGDMFRSRKRFAYEITLFVFPFKAHLGALHIDRSVPISVHYAGGLRVRKPLVVDKALRGLDIGSVEAVHGNVRRGEPRVDDADSGVHFEPLGVSHILEQRFIVVCGVAAFGSSDEHGIPPHGGFWEKPRYAFERT